MNPLRRGLSNDHGHLDYHEFYFKNDMIRLPTAMIRRLLLDSPIEDNEQEIRTTTVAYCHVNEWVHLDPPRGDNEQRNQDGHLSMVRPSYCSNLIHNKLQPNSSQTYKLADDRIESSLIVLESQIDSKCQKQGEEPMDVQLTRK